VVVHLYRPLRRISLGCKCHIVRLLTVGYCFTPTDTEAYYRQLVTLYWHQRTSSW
jgi:hypothetical protein